MSASLLFKPVINAVLPSNEIAAAAELYSYKAGSTVLYPLYLDENNIWRTMGAAKNSVADFVYGLAHNSDYTIGASSGQDDQGIYLVRSSIVPIPAALWLFGSGLIGLGWFKRKEA